MPAKPQPLKAKEPKARPEGIRDEVWQFPKNLAEWGNAKGQGQQAIAKMAGVSQPTISRWLEFKGIDKVPVQTVLMIEDGLGLPRNALISLPTAMREPATAAELRGRSERLWDVAAAPPRLAEFRDLAIERLVQKGRRLAVAARGANAALAYAPPRGDSDEAPSVDHLVALAERIIELESDQDFTFQTKGVGTTTDHSLKPARAAARAELRGADGKSKNRRGQRKPIDRSSNQRPRADKKVR